LATVLGILGGVVAAVRQYSKLDYLISFGTLFGVSMPVYWLGLMLIIVFAVHLHWLPAAGADRPTSFILPSLTLAAFSIALVARMTRSSMLEVLRQDYVRTARAKGLGEELVIYRHALKNALIPVVTVVGLQFGTLLGGAVLTESVFGWPGIGLLLVDSIFARDYPLCLHRPAHPLRVNWSSPCAAPKGPAPSWRSGRDSDGTALLWWAFSSLSASLSSL